MEEPQTKPNFDCSICLDFASQPVVTLCGHLYCWPCMYKWLEHQTKTETPQQCPVCKASLSQTALVPLYGRGREDSKPESIPDRPAYRQERRESVPPERRTTLSPPTRAMRGLDEANARSLHQLLPWCFCGEEGYYVDGGEADPRRARREMEARVSLHRISTFLFMCVVACWLLF